MTHYKCNSCSATYYDIDTNFVGEKSQYYHVCPEYDADDKVIEDPRNENIKNEEGQIISEGLGRTEIN